MLRSLKPTGYAHSVTLHPCIMVSSPYFPTVLAAVIDFLLWNDLHLLSDLNLHQPCELRLLTFPVTSLNYSAFPIPALGSPFHPLKVDCEVKGGWLLSKRSCIKFQANGTPAISIWLTERVEEITRSISFIFACIYPDVMKCFNCSSEEQQSGILT